MKVPVYNSVINWNLRFGLSKLNSVERHVGRWVAIVDTSIETGGQKALVCLRVSLVDWNRHSRAISLKDCECIGVKVRKDWTGDLVEEALNEMFKESGKPLLVIRDKGSDLVKGVKQAEIASVDDIGHELANGLKERFSKHKWFKRLLSTVSSINKKLCITEWSWLNPPKIRSKGRFQSISRVAEWAKKVLDLLENGELEPLRDKPVMRLFIALRQSRKQINSFLKCCITTNKILELLKKNGLTSETERVVRDLCNDFTPSCPVKKRVIKWLDKHTALKDKILTDLAMPVSSDVIESLFGKLKLIISRQPRKELNHLVLMVPSLCGVHTAEDIRSGINQVTCEELKQWKISNLPKTSEKHRREMNNKRKLLAEKECKNSGTPELQKTG